MPLPAISLPTGLFSSTAYPFTITIDGMEVSQALVDFDSLVVEDVAADDANGNLSLRFWDADSSRAVRLQAVVQVYDDTIDEHTFLGLVQRRQYVAQAIGRWVEIEAVSIGWLLDHILVPYETRPIESDNARVGYLWGKYARSPFSGDFSQVAQTNAAIAADFLANLTLRQALSQTAELAGSTVHFYPDAVGRPHWFAGTESTPGAAPYNINVALSPGGGNIAPDDLSVERDGNITNRFYVRGANEEGSGWYQDDASVGEYGPREDYLDAPSSDTAAKARTIALMQLGRVAQPNVRGSFGTEEPYNGWRGGQNITLTSVQDDLAAYATRLVKVTTRFTKGTATRRYKMEFADTGARLSGSPAFGGAGIPGQILTGEITDNDGNAILSTDPGVTGGVFGPAARRQITSGVANGDFALAPPATTAEITGSNPLPYWALSKTGTQIRANSDGDPSAASGRIIRFAMGPGAASDDTYIEQLLPVNGARGRSFVYIPGVTFVTGPTVSNAQMYITAQYLRADGTTTGSALTAPVTTTSVGANTMRDIQAGAANAGQIPSDAYYLRVRVGFRRNTAATTLSETVTLCEVRLSVGGTQLLTVEGTDPASFGYGVMYQIGGLLHVAANQGGASGSSPDLRLNGSGATGEATWANAPVLQLGSGGTADPGATAGKAVYRTDRRVLVAHDGLRVRGISAAGWQAYAYGAGGGPTNTATTARDLAVSGGSIQIPIVLEASMDAWTIVIWSTDTANAREAEWRLYEWRNTHTTDATEIPGLNGTWSFTPTVASQRTSTPSGGTVVSLGPGAYVLVIRNTSGSQTFGIGEQAGGTLALNTSKTKTLGSALGATLDLTTGWTGLTAVPAVRLGTTW